MPNPSRDRTSRGRFAKGNKVNMKHGRYSYLAMGRAPQGCEYIGRLVGQFRKALEAAVTEKHGEVALYHAALIQSACRHEGRAQLLTRWLRLCDELSYADRLATLKEVGAASDARDKALKAIGLHDVDDRQTIIDQLYGPRITEVQDGSNLR